MAGLDPADRLALWERAAGEHPLDRALTLLSALGQGTREDLARLPIAERDRRLYAAAGAICGPALALTWRCAECDAETELSVRVDDVLALPAPDPQRQVAWQGDWLAYREPDSLDLAAALRAGPQARAELMRRILGRDPAPGLAEAVEADMARRAGLEAMEIAFACSGCGRRTAVPFDILDYLWRRLAADAQRLLRQIHQIAGAYGWTSAEILSLGEARRAAHIALIGP